jgi:predicted membrane-bound spermidine synthase
MTRKLFRHFNRNITSNTFDAEWGPIVAWSVSILVLVLGFLTLASLQLTAAQLFFGLLLVVTVALLGVIVGMLIPVAQAVNQMRLDKKQ